MKITDILAPDCIRVPLQSSDKSDAITELVDVLHEKGHLTDRDAVLHAVLERERTRSTGIGLGLGVPHGKTSACTKLVMALGKPASPMEFESADGKPVKIVVLLISPADKTGPHIQALASVSRLWQTETFREILVKAQTAEEIYDAVVRHQE